MSDVKKFTGFIAIDGSTHTSMKSATDHSRQVKIQRALAEKFVGLSVSESVTSSNSEDDGVTMPDFIYANRDAILACLNQDVLTRKKRAPNKAKAKAETVDESAKAVSPVVEIDDELNAILA